MRYWMMQLSLVRRDEGTLFFPLDPRQSRQEYIQSVFNRETRFEYWNAPYVFKPFPTPDNTILIGVIGRQHVVSVAGGPEEGFIQKDIQDWETANVLIDSGPVAQTVAMQHRTQTNPLNIFHALVEHINSHTENSIWSIAVNSITRQEQFWEVAERYRDHLKELDLSFQVPNIWGGSTETEDALKKFRDENNAQEVDFKIKKRDGKLQPDSERIRQSVDYIAKGGGEVQLRDDHDAVVYSSATEESVVTTPIDPDFPIQEADQGMIRSLIQRIFGK